MFQTTNQIIYIERSEEKKSPCLIQARLWERAPPNFSDVTRHRTSLFFQVLSIPDGVLTRSQHHPVTNGINPLRGLLHQGDSPKSSWRLRRILAIPKLENPNCNMLKLLKHTKTIEILV